MDHSERSTADDGQLVTAVAGGDEAALSEIYRRYGAVVTGLARRILGDKQLAEDITQEVFVQLWKNADRFDADRGKLRTVLLTQTHGKCVDLIRSRNARSAREQKVIADVTNDSPAIDAELIALTETEQIRTAVKQLPTDERIALEAAYFGGNTYRQVAVVLGIPEGTVKARIRSGLRRLHGLLSEISQDDDHHTNDQHTNDQHTNDQHTTRNTTGKIAPKDTSWNA
jgi:RNA polymerase sigma-70 factor, ECF subfamily